MLTASIVTYLHSEKTLQEVLNCALKSSIEILYIIDHSPSDDLKSITALSPKIRYIRHKNLGYGSGHNVAIRLAMESNADYHAVLNPDISFEPGVLDTLSACMDRNSDVGQIMPKVFYPDGRLQPLCKLIPTPWNMIARGFLPKSAYRKTQERFTLSFTGYDHKMNVPYLSGCFMFFRLSALKEIGLFDERFFMYPEDCDITRRMHRKYKTLFLPEVSIVHAHEAASKKSLKMLKVHIVNQIRYFNKWGWLFDRERRTVNRQLLKDEGYGLANGK